jgi:hypothetical protein
VCVCSRGIIAFSAFGAFRSGSARVDTRCLPVTIEEVIHGPLCLRLDLPIPEPFIPWVIHRRVEEVVLVTGVPVPDHRPRRQRRSLLQRERPGAPNPSTPHLCSPGGRLPSNPVGQVDVFWGEGEEPADAVFEFIPVCGFLARSTPGAVFPALRALGLGGSCLDLGSLDRLLRCPSILVSVMGGGWVGRRCVPRRRL